MPDTESNLNTRPTNESDAREALAQILQAAVKGQDVEEDLYQLTEHVGGWMMTQDESYTWTHLFNVAGEITDRVSCL